LLRNDSKLKLSGFQVESNSQGLVRVEQQLNLGGAMELLGNEEQGFDLKNGTNLILRDVFIVQLHADNEKYYSIHLPEVAAASLTPFKFSETGEDKLNVNALTADSAVLQAELSTGETGELKLGRFTQLAFEQLSLLPGEIRLIAWVDNEIPGVSYNPPSAQVNAKNFVIAHLRRAAFPALSFDQNALQDIVTQELEPINIAPENEDL
jgi:hypothetical protein